MAARNDNGITTNTSTQLTTPPPHPPSKHFPPSIHIHTPPPHSTSPHTHMPPAATHINAHPFHIPRHTHTRTLHDTHTTDHHPHTGTQTPQSKRPNSHVRHVRRCTAISQQVPAKLERSRATFDNGVSATQTPISNRSTRPATRHQQEACGQPTPGTGRRRLRSGTK